MAGINIQYLLTCREWPPLMKRSTTLCCPASALTPLGGQSGSPPHTHPPLPLFFAASCCLCLERVSLLRLWPCCRSPRDIGTLSLPGVPGLRFNCAARLRRRRQTESRSTLMLSLCLCRAPAISDAPSLSVSLMRSPSVSHSAASSLSP